MVIQIDLNMMLVVLSAPVLNMEVALLGGRNVRPYGLITNQKAMSAGKLHITGRTHYNSFKRDTLHIFEVLFRLIPLYIYICNRCGAFKEFGPVGLRLASWRIYRRSKVRGSVFGCACNKKRLALWRLYWGALFLGA